LRVISHKKPVQFSAEHCNTEQDYQQALNRLEETSTAKRNTTEGDELEILGILLKKNMVIRFS